ncbi:hypothetical protein Vafri_7167, partial [Volvox africanus]
FARQFGVANALEQSGLSTPGMVTGDALRTIDAIVPSTNASPLGAAYNSDAAHNLIAQMSRPLPTTATTQDEWDGILRDNMVLSSLPASVTVVTLTGQALYQNPSSKTLFGIRLHIDSSSPAASG